MYSVQCTVYIVQCTVYNVKCRAALSSNEIYPGAPPPLPTQWSRALYPGLQCIVCVYSV